MEKNLAEQEREVKDIIRRAKGTPDKTSSSRRDTLKRLIDLIHSPHPPLKILAAGNIRFFFSDFPELEEAAINAVYDLCEDQSAKVRIEGYNAITQVSKADNKWVKRNADVLVQLLQSDEPDEVVVVKKALTEHLDMDPRVTLGVLCDQIAPLDEPMDEEEQNIRDHLRSLVLSFLSGEAKRAIVERHAVPGSGAEEVLINGLLTAISKLGFTDIEAIVKDLLLSLAAYKSNSTRGQSLLTVLLEKTVASLRTDLRPGKTVSLELTRPYLDLVAFLVVERNTASPIELIRFYCSSLAGKMTLQRLTPDDQTLVVCQMAETLVACDRDAKPLEKSQLAAIQRQIVDACPVLLEPLARPGQLHRRSAKACVILLQSCFRRKDESSWTVPPHLATALKNIQALPESEQYHDVQNLIRSLVPLPKSNTEPPRKTEVQEATPAMGTLQPIRSKDNGHPSLPDRPLTNTTPARRMVISSKARPRDHDPTTEPPPGRTGPIPSTSKHNLTPDESPRPPKKRKDVMEGDTDAPSLLSRLGTSLTNGSRPNITRRPNSGIYSLPAAEARPQTPTVGFSIKGAAAKVAAESDSRQPIQPAPPSSLLDRLQGGGPPTHTNDGTGPGGRRKKKWGESQ